MSRRRDLELQDRELRCRATYVKLLIQQLVVSTHRIWGVWSKMRMSQQLDWYEGEAMGGELETPASLSPSRWSRKAVEGRKKEYLDKAAYFLTTYRREAPKDGPKELNDK